jgi:hypothetical protein
MLVSHSRLSSYSTATAGTRSAPCCKSYRWKTTKHKLLTFSGLTPATIKIIPKNSQPAPFLRAIPLRHILVGKLLAIGLMFSLTLSGRNHHERNSRLDDSFRTA